MANQLRSTVRLDKVKSVYNSHIFSVRATQLLENGHFVKLGDLEAKNIEVHGMAVPKAKDKLVLIANPAIIYDNTSRMGADQERYYFMETGEVVRAYEIVENDVISVSKLGIDGTAVVGEYLVAGAGTKLVPSSSPATSGFCAKVVRFDKIGGALSINLTQTATEYVVMEVLAN